jgi:hypothetical protein
MRIDRVERSEVDVLSLTCADDTAEFPAAWEQLERAIGSLRSRRWEPDPSRPSIEHYRRRDEIDLLLPVVAPND